MTHAQQGIKRVTVEAVVLNADGTVKQDLGIVAEYHRNPLRRAVNLLRRRGRVRLTGNCHTEGTDA